MRSENSITRKTKNKKNVLNTLSLKKSILNIY